MDEWANGGQCRRCEGRGIRGQADRWVGGEGGLILGQDHIQRYDLVSCRNKGVMIHFQYNNE